MAYRFETTGRKPVTVVADSRLPVSGRPEPHIPMCGRARHGDQSVLELVREQIRVFRLSARNDGVLAFLPAIEGEGGRNSITENDLLDIPACTSRPRSGRRSGAFTPTRSRPGRHSRLEGRRRGRGPYHRQFDGQRASVTRGHRGRKTRNSRQRHGIRARHARRGDFFVGKPAKWPGTGERLEPLRRRFQDRRKQRHL